MGGDHTINFETVDGRKFQMFHLQDCCEGVFLEDVCGDLADLIGHPILTAEEVTSDVNPPDAKPDTIEYQECFMWTFYKFATIKGNVTLRWYGDSNGYYSVAVSFEEIKQEED